MKELLEQIGKERLLEIEGLKVKVKILDIRKAYGRTDYLVMPISGTGEKWVSSDRLSN